MKRSVWSEFTETHPSPSAPKAVRKRVRKNRIFSYRGLTFFIKVEQETATVFSVDAGNKAAKAYLTVKSADADKAARVVARIILSERELEDLEVKSSLAHIARKGIDA